MSTEVTKLFGMLIAATPRDRDDRFRCRPWSPSRTVRERLMIARGPGISVWDMDGHASDVLVHHGVGDRVEPGTLLAEIHHNTGDVADVAHACVIRDESCGPTETVRVRRATGYRVSSASAPTLARK
jgi:hypothetical protein